MVTFKVISILYVLFNLSFTRILTKNKKTQQQVQKSLRQGGIELEIGAFPCYAESDDFQEECYVNNYGIQQLTKSCIVNDSKYRFGYQDGVHWQLGYDVTKLIKDDILWSRIQSKYSQVSGQEKTNQDYEFRTVGPNDLQTLQSSIRSFKTFYDPFYQAFKEQQYKMTELPVFTYHNIPICVKLGPQQQNISIKPQFTFSIPIIELKNVIKDFPVQFKSPLFKNLITQYGGQIETSSESDQQKNFGSITSKIYNRMNDIDLGPLMDRDNTGIVSYFNIFKNLFCFEAKDVDEDEQQFREDIVQKGGYNNLKYFLPFLPRNAEILYFNNNTIAKDILNYIFDYYQQEGQRLIPHHIQFEDQQSKNQYENALQNYLNTLKNTEADQKFYRGILNKKKAFLQRADIKKYEYSLFEYLLDIQIVLQDQTLLAKCQNQYLMNCLYRKFEEDQDFGYEYLIPTTVVKTGYDRVVIELRMMPVIKDNNIEAAFKPYFDYIFNQF